MPLVCAIHQGFLDGYLDATGAGLEAGELEVNPSTCTVTIHAG